MQQTHKLNISLEGSFLTDIIQKLVVEGNWSKAYSFLQEIEGISASEVQNILEGRMRLTGVNEFKVEPIEQESQFVKNALSQKYSTLFKYKSKIYQPYAFVDNWTKEDFSFAREYLNEGCFVNTHFFEAYSSLSYDGHKSFYKQLEDGCFHSQLLAVRSLAYSSQPDKDLAFVQLVDNCPKVILAKVYYEEIPPWIEIKEGNRLSVASRVEESILCRASSFVAKNNGKEEDCNQGTPTTSSCAELTQSNFGLNETQSAEQVYGARIRQFADNDFEYGWKIFSRFDPDCSKEVSIRVPYRAFLAMALNRIDLLDKILPYLPICPIGLKQFSDSAYHSDAWIGSGFLLDDAYNSEMPEQRLFMDMIEEEQRKHSSFDFYVICKGNQGGSLKGVVVTDPNEANKESILVLKNADAEYSDALLKSKAVICEYGSKVAHLAIIGRENKIPILRVSDASLIFKEGMTICVDMTQGRLQIIN